jgi:acetylornithine deacetylase/succinyl-diaminopimelate desuccinylase-like protein
MNYNYRDLLAQVLNFQTMSHPMWAKPEEIEKCLCFYEDLFSSGDIKTERWLSEKLNPILFAEKFVHPTFPTVLVYGHYDVVPADQKTWKSDPFVAEERDGLINARGATDNKGQHMAYIVEVLQAIQDGKLACNVKFFLEGNEETGSTGIEKIVEERKDRLECHVILVSDGEMVNRTPVIERSLRGALNLKVTVSTSTMDSHSGNFGGAIFNSTLVAAQLIESMYDSYGDVNMAGFHADESLELWNDDAVEENNSKLGELVDLKTLLGVGELKDDRNIFHTVGLASNMEVTGIISGGANTGFKNIIPGTTVFGLNVRLVGRQTPEYMLNLISEHLKENTPECASVTIESTFSCPPVMLNLPPALEAQIKSMLAEVYEVEPLYKFVGGSIPVVGHMQDILGVTPLLIPLSTIGCNMHSDDENLPVWHAERALKFGRKFFTTPLNVA